MSEKQYINVSEFIQNSSVLRYDGTYYNHDDLFAYAYPTGGVMGISFYGTPSAFGAASVTAINGILPEITDPIKKIGAIGRTLVILDDNNQISFYRVGGIGGNDDAYINSEFSEVLSQTGIIDFDVQNNGDDATAGAVFISSTGKPIFYRIPTPASIDSLMSGKFANKVAVDRDKNFCLGFSDYSIIYYNGYGFDDPSYRLISTDVINSQNYEVPGFENSPKETPNNLTDVRMVSANGGFSVVTGNGRVVVWGGEFQKINDNESDVILPTLVSNIESIQVGLDYGVALTKVGGLMVWGVDTDGHLTVMSDETRQVVAMSILDDTAAYTVNRGRDVVFSKGDNATSTYTDIQVVYSKDEFIDKHRYLTHMADGDGFGFAYTEHLNESFDPVRLDFKMIQHNGEYFIPLTDYFPFDVAGLRLETFNRVEQSNGTLGQNVKFAIDSSYVSVDGNPDRSKVIVSPIDADSNGVPDDPFAFKQIVGDDDYIFMETFIDTDGSESTRIARDVRNISDIAFFAPGAIVYADITREFTDVYGESHTYEAGRFFRGVDTINNVLVNKGEEISMGYDEAGGKRYTIENGRGYTSTQPFMFQWNHYASGGGDIIDPSISNLMDMYILTSSYDIAVRRWLKSDGNIDTMPVPPTSEELRDMIRFIEPNKSTSDQIIYIPARYRILFGESALPEHQATFNVVKTTGATMSDNEIKSRIINAINEYFNIDNWDFGDKFYFSELSGYIHNSLVGEIASVVIVPKFRDASFGDLYQIHSEPNELFLSSASVSDITINPYYTNQNMRRGGQR